MLWGVCGWEIVVGRGVWGDRVAAGRVGFVRRT